MSGIEIALLAVGLIVFILSFLIPVKTQEASEDIKDMISEEVKKKVKDEIDAVRSHVDDVVDEAVEYAQEKTERSLERISNEKIMAVNEYSDTVLEEINKNHKEVMFLYDMLNDKHDDLMSTVSEANQAAKEAQEATKAAEEAKNEAQEAVTNFKSLTPDNLDASIRPIPVAEQIPVPVSRSRKPSKQSEGGKVRTLKWAAIAEEAAGVTSQDNGFGDEVENNTGASGKEKGEETPQAALHEEILTLHKLGKSDIEIARDLNMGVGEVSLIIGLHSTKE